MNGIKLFNDLMEYADGKGASDVHLVPGRTAMLRIDGELTAAGQELSLIHISEPTRP